MELALRPMEKNNIQGVFLAIAFLLLGRDFGVSGVTISNVMIGCCLFGIVFISWFVRDKK